LILLFSSVVEKQKFDVKPNSVRFLQNKIPFDFSQRTKGVCKGGGVWNSAPRSTRSPGGFRRRSDNLDFIVILFIEFSPRTHRDDKHGRLFRFFSGKAYILLSCSPVGESRGNDIIFKVARTPVHPAPKVFPAAVENP